MAKYDFGPLQKYADESNVSEIMINGHENIFVERAGRKYKADAVFKNAEELRRFVDKLLEATGKRPDDVRPYADACLEDGTRINVILPPISRSGISITIRKFSDDIQSLEDIVKVGTLSQNAADFLIACIKGRINIIFSGGTAVGKTTTLKALSRYFSQDERVVTVEDTAELRIQHPNIVSLETKDADINGRGVVSIRDLIRNTLRMSPDRIVVGEIRGSEALDMIQAMATGHNGTLGVMHGNSPQDVMSRLETMILMSGINIPHSEIRKMIGSTINLIVHQEKVAGGARRVTHITEVQGLERGDLTYNQLYSYQNAGVTAEGQPIKKLVSCQKSYPQFYRRFQDQGLFPYNVFSN